jgi:hypothetical protein
VSTENRIHEISESFGLDVAAYWEPGFIPEDGEWPRGARQKQQAAFDAGYAALRKLKRGRRECLPYALEDAHARALARIALAMEDPRTPKDVKSALKVHLRDLVRADGLLYEARPLRLPDRETKISPAVRRVFHALYRNVLAVCRTGGSVADVLRASREHLPSPITITEDQRGALKEIVNAGKKPAKGQTAHVFAKQMLGKLLGISDKYVRKLIYEGGRANRGV